MIHSIRIMDPKKTLRAIARHRAGMAFEELIEKGIAFVPGEGMEKGLVKALEGKVLVATHIESGAPLLMC